MLHSIERPHGLSIEGSDGSIGQILDVFFDDSSWATDSYRRVLQSDACIRRGLYQPAYVDKLLADPQPYFARIQGSKLWHLALLEWPQVHVDDVAHHAVTQPRSGALASASHA